jgi:branched-chain amino acid aminotransferase
VAVGSYLGDDGIKNGIRVKTSSYQRFHVNTMMTKARRSDTT